MVCEFSGTTRPAIKAGNLQTQMGALKTNAGPACLKNTKPAGDIGAQHAKRHFVGRMHGSQCRRKCATQGDSNSGRASGNWAWRSRKACHTKTSPQPCCPSELCSKTGRMSTIISATTWKPAGRTSPVTTSTLVQQASPKTRQDLPIVGQSSQSAAQLPDQSGELD